MKRAYRPRLSKDKAVAQRLQDLSTARELAAVEALEAACTPSSSPPAAQAAVGEADAIETTARPSDAAAELSSTPAQTPLPLKEDGSSSRSRRNSNRAKTPTPAGKQKGGRARAAAGTTATATGSKSAGSAAVSPASSFKRGGSSSSRKQRDVPVSTEGGSGGGDGGGSRKGEWACVSCSFLNPATAKKCRMCSTKNYQARLSPPTASAPAPSPTVTAATTATDAPRAVGGSRESVVRDTDPQRRRQSGGDARERRSPRRASQETSTADTSSTTVASQKGLEGKNPASNEPGVLGDAGAGEDGSVDGCGDGAGTSRRNRRRDSASRRASTASAVGAESVALSLSVDEPEAAAVPTAAAGADSAPRRKRGRKMMDGDATVVVGAVTPSGSGGRGGDGDGRSTGGADGVEHLNPRKKHPSSPCSASSQKRGKKRPRPPSQTPPPTAAAAKRTEEVNAAAHLSPITVTHPTEQTSREDLSMPPLSGEADPSPLLACGGDGPTAEANGHDLRPPARTSPRKVQAISPPCVVPPLTGDCYEREDGLLEGSALDARTTRRRGRSSTTEVAASTRNPSATSAPLALEGESSSHSGGGHRTSTFARVASLDFGDRPSWKVSSVVVFPAGGGRGRPPGAATTASPTATIVVCHSGGVSVWGLTDAEAVCMYLSPALAGVTKEVVSGTFLAAAVVGGDPAEVTSSATRAPGGNETCIVAVGRHATDPGSPIIRVWQQQPQQQGQQGASSPLLPLPPQDAERLGRRNSSHDTGGTAVRERVAPPSATTPPAVLTISLKKKFSAFFKTPVPRHVRPCLCVCGYEPAATAAAESGLEKDGEVNVGAAFEDGGAGAAEKTTAVMALGGKVLKLVFGAVRSGEQYFRAKALPTGVASEAVCTSLAPVPSNPFLVCASLPSANAVVLWDVRETERLFTLPLTTLSICVPAITGAAREAMALSLLHSNGGATTAAATTAAAAAAAGPCGYSESESESSPGPPSVGPKRPRPGEMSTVIAVAAARRRGPQLLCLLATGNRHGCVDAAKEERKAGCRLFGIVCVGDGDGAGAHSCAKVSTIPLEAGTETEGRAQPAPGLSETQRNGGGSVDDIRRGNVTSSDNDHDACLRCLSDGGNGFVVGVDGRGTVVATSATTGESRILLTSDAARATASGSADVGATFVAIDYEHSSGIVALAAAGGSDRGAAATSVDLYEVRMV